MDDVAERQQALQASEERARLALEAGHMGTWWYDPDKSVGGWSSQAAATARASADADLRRCIARTGCRSFIPTTWIAWSQKCAGLPSETRAITRTSTGSGIRTASIRWINSKGRVFFDIDRKAGLFRRHLPGHHRAKQAEEQQRFFLDELNHRVKNTLTTVQSIASQTLRTTETPAQFKDAFEGRLLALSKTHDLLTRKSWREAELRDVAEQELAPYRKQGDERVVLAGRT